MATMKFRLMHGTHACNDSFKGVCPKCREVGLLTDAACKKCAHKMLPTAGWVPIERAYKVGDVIETTQDLDKMNGFVQDPNSLQKIKVGKFMPLHEDGQVAMAYPPMAKARVVDIGEMSLDELRQFSEEEELGVDFDKLKTADDARKAVRAARKVATQ